MKRLLLSALLLILSANAAQAVEAYTVMSGREERKQMKVTEERRGPPVVLLQADDPGVKETLVRFYSDLGLYNPAALDNGVSFTRIIRVKTLALGAPEEFAPYDDARDKRQEQVNTILGLGVFLASLGRVDIGGIASGSDNHLTADALSKLPPGAKKVIVTRVDLGFRTPRNSQADFSPNLSREIITAAYEDISDDELRAINLREGIIRYFHFYNVFKAWEAGEIKQPVPAKTADAAQ